MRHLPFLAALLLALPSAHAAVYEIDASHSAIIWGIQHLGLGNTYGRFNDLSGTITFDKANLPGSSVIITAKVGSIDSGNKKRDDHLRAADFFDAGTYPDLSFKGTGLKATGEEGQYEVTGELTMRGVTKTVTVPIRLVGMGEHAMAKKPAIGFEGEFMLPRRDYGLATGQYDKAVGEEVRVIIALEGIAK